MQKITLMKEAEKEEQEQDEEEQVEEGDILTFQKTKQDKGIPRSGKRWQPRQPAQRDNNNTSLTK